MPPGGVQLVTPDLARAGDGYAATYTAHIDQPGHPSISKTVGPVTIPSIARTSNDYYAYSFARATVDRMSAHSDWFKIITSASDDPSLPQSAFGPPLTASDFPPPDIPPPADGARAFADEIPEWEVRLPVNIAPGAWHQDLSPPIPPVYAPDANGVPQLIQAAVPVRPLGTWQCQGFDMSTTGDPPILTRGSPAVPDSLSIPGGYQQMADEIWQHWRSGTVATLPSAGGTTYVGVPTCAWIDGTGRPDREVNLPSKSEVTGRSLRGPVTITEYIDVRVIPEPVQWHFDDPDGQPSGYEAGRGARPATTPQYDPVTQTWPTPQSYCQVFHRYSKVRDGIRIFATQTFDFTITGYFNNGTGRTDLTPISYRRDARWDAPPMHVFQIQAVPFVPSATAPSSSP